MTNTQFVDIHERFFARVTIDYCRSCRICLDRDNTGTYKLFVTNRTKPFVVDSIRRLIEDPLNFVVVDDIELDRRIDLAFEANRLANRTQEPSGNAENPVAAVLHSADDTNDLLQDQSATPVIELVNRILFDAVQQQASDIHFQPVENAMVVRMRMDGVLFDTREIPKSLQEEVLTRIKVAGRMDIAEKRLPQDGRATVHVGKRVIDLRIASMPSSHGERIVVRLLDKSARLYRLPELGMDPLSLQRFRNAISVEYGLILVTGPTGSGKSTTLYSALQELDTRERNAVTYDAGGNQLTVRDPNNVGADMVYDLLGRNTQRTDTFGDVTKTDYDRAGNAVKQTDAKNKYTLISFDSRNRRKSTTDRISAPTTFTYLATSQLASLTDAESQSTAYTYDARGSKLTEQFPDHSSGSTVGQPGYGIVTFVYDKAGRVSRKQDQAGDTCTYNYDLAGRMTQRDYRSVANSPSGAIADSDTFTFDRSGRMLTAISGRYNNTVGYAFDPVGRKASESLTIASQTYTVGSEFNARNELVKYTYPDISVANRAYNTRGGLSELKLDGSVIDTRSYDDGGRMTSEVLGNGITETRSYRNDNLLSGISYSNTNIGNLGYSWDANKNKTAETIGGVMSGYGFTSTGTAYDDEDRLTGYQRAATSGSALLAQSWALTSVGDEWYLIGVRS